MLIRIPPFRERYLPVDESKNFWEGIRRNDGVYEYSEDEDYYSSDEEHGEDIDGEEDEESGEEDNKDGEDGEEEDDSAFTTAAAV